MKGGEATTEGGGGEGEPRADDAGFVVDGSAISGRSEADFSVIPLSASESSSEEDDDVDEDEEGSSFVVGGALDGGCFCVTFDC